MKRYSSDFRLSAIKAVINKVATKRQVYELYGCSRATLTRWLREYRDTEKLEPNKPTGRPQLLSEADKQCIVELIETSPDITSAEILSQLKLNICRSSIDNYIKRLGFNYKKNSKGKRTR